MTVELRLVRLESRLRRAQLLAGATGLGLIATLAPAFARPAAQADEVDHLRVHRLDVVDDAGVVRVSLGQDTKDVNRRARSAGLLLFDKTGNERGGFSTLDDGSVVLAMDAPVGVGAPMRDRLGLVVWPDGSSYVMLIDNETCGVVKLTSDGKGSGGLQTFKWDIAAKKVHVKTETYDGAVHETMETGG